MSVDGFLKLSHGHPQLKKLVFIDQPIKRIPYSNYRSLEYVAVCTENSPAELLFTGNPDAQIYIDDSRQENIKSGYIDEKNNVHYFHPSLPSDSGIESNKFYLFQNLNKLPSTRAQVQNSMVNYGPGIYTITVKELGESTKYSYLYILPKYLTEKELNTMRDDVEGVVAGLARSFDLVKNGRLTINSGLVHQDTMTKMAYLNENEKKFRRELFEIKEKPRQTIKKKYRWQIPGKGRLDLLSNRIMTTQFRDDKKQYSFNRVVSADLSDNRVIKNQLIQFNNEIVHLQHINDSKIQRFQDRAASHKKIVSELKKNQEMLVRYKTAIRSLLSNSFLQGIQGKNGRLSYSAMLDETYRSLYTMINNLLNNDRQNDIFVRQHVYDWIRTQDLYEIWCFVRTIESLIDIGLQPTNGWIFDDDFDDLSVLDATTSVNFKLCNSEGELILKLQAQYNARIPKHQGDSELLWTTSHHFKPDIILTLIDPSDTLLSALVLDSKYRNFAKSTVLDSVKDQLIGYLDGIKSQRYLNTANYADLQMTDINSKSPVANTGVLFPKLLDTDKLPEFPSTLKITPIELRVGVGDGILKRFIEDGLLKALVILDKYYFKESKVTISQRNDLKQISEALHLPLNLDD